MYSIEGLMWIQLNSAMFEELCRYCLQDCALMSVCRVQPIATTKTVSDFKTPVGSHCPTTQLDRSYSQQGKLHLVARDVHLGLCILCYFEISLTLPSHMYTFQEASGALDFHIIIQMALNFRCLPPSH